MSSTLDPRIGILNSGIHYAYINGYSAEPFMGTRQEVEAHLFPAKETKKTDTYTVILRFQYPAWDEKDGIHYPDIPARSKSEAIRIARQKAEADGHAIGGRGRYWFTAAQN